MIIPPDYKITPEIVELIAKIDANRMYFQFIPIPPDVKSNIQRISLLKSSLFSARIEGNPLTMDEIIHSDDRQKKLEVFNILSAVRYIESTINQINSFTAADILTIHTMVMSGLDGSEGIFRDEMGAIFNNAGVAIYLPPPPGQIHQLIGKLTDYINSQDEKFPLIAAFIAHLVFEKIHPFTDGNGRTGRLLILNILVYKKWLFNLNIVLEEYLDNHRDDYYHYLDIGMQNPTDYLLFMLNAFWQQSEKIKKQVAEESLKKLSVILPPRQEEIYNLISDHKLVSFDMVRRRFLNVPERTLRYDLKKLADKKLIIKVGRTRGAFYSSAKEV